VIKLKLLGGRHDGLTINLESEYPPTYWKIPIESTLDTFLEDVKLEHKTVNLLMYELVFDGNGYPSRTDDGTYNYYCKGIQ
jgi:hypothetical protein